MIKEPMPDEVLEAYERLRGAGSPAASSPRLAEAGLTSGIGPKRVPSDCSVQER